MEFIRIKFSTIGPAFKFTDKIRVNFYCLSGLVRIVDKYAELFFSELDFTKEQNRSDGSPMQITINPTRPSSSTVVPMTYKEHSSEKVLISEWMDTSK